MDNKFRSWIMKHLEKKEWVYRNEDERQEMYKSAVQGGYMGSFESFSRKVRKAKNEVRGTQEPILTSVLPEKNNIYMEEEGNEGVVTSECSTQIKSIEQLLEACNVDMDKWILKSQKVNAWNAQTKEGELATLFQVKGYLEKKVPDVQRIPVVQPIQFNHPVKYKPDSLTSGIIRTLILGDAQIGYHKNQSTGELNPFHDIKAMEVLLKVVSDNYFDEVIINGDMLDFTEASKYTQLPSFAFTLQHSVNYLGEWLSQLRANAPKSRITYLIGNHEVRLKNQLVENFKFAYDLKAYKDDIPFYSLNKLLDLPSLDINLIEEYPKGTYWLGDTLKVLHGEFTNASKELSTSNTSVIMGHLHHLETLSKSVHNREGICQVQVVVHGCLCKIDGTVPGVNTRPSWQQGVVVVEQVSGIDAINHAPIVDGAMIYNGKVYHA
jgi:hypothetical protein